MKKNLALALFAFATLLPLHSQAHDAWILPSATVLSGEEAWVTVDASIGNDKFHFNHAPMRLDGLEITSPSGKAIEPQNSFAGKLRSGFDAHLTEDGTYQIAVVANGSLMARWKEDGKNKRWFGSAKDYSSNVPENAEDLVVNERVSRVETFVTKGQPTPPAKVSQGYGLTSTPHPNDLYAGEKATFVLTLDGQPAAQADVEIVPAASRYRDSLNEIKIKTNDKGEFEVSWPQAGQYWLHAESADDKTSTPVAKKRALSYSATLEVLPQ